MNTNKLHKQINLIGERAQAASQIVSGLSIDERNKILLSFASEIEKNSDKIVEINVQELKEHRDDLSLPMQKRLQLSKEKISTIASSLKALVKLADPLSEGNTSWQAKAGFKVVKKTVPLGVVAMIYEARPNVTIDAAALTIKSANAVILRGGKESIKTNQVLVSILQQSLKKLGYSENIVQLIEDTSHDSVKELLHLRKFIDVLIPRGSGSFINYVVDNSTVPVIETGAGNDHIFVDKSADQEEAIKVIVNSKVQNPSVCNSAEKLLVHADIAKEFLPKLFDRLSNEGVEIRGDKEVQLIDNRVELAKDFDWDTEYNDLIIAVHLVNNLKEAIDWIGKHTTHHTEAILTNSAENASEFMQRIDAAVVTENASTRFTDGFEFGFGAEIGISTQKLHARGPMGLTALTSYKYEIFGHGEIRK
ncbi:glutamate-5-semialdehyde dehydrogenase [Oenococcus oeni]|nr:glutamate-5-semialdehyde dehydrogenase [Oenococcus oeni]KGO16911.1 gamma-glutamyl phosphate reductase [Oenococcus oeni X2L]EJO01807.1 glutamate-5-semialdehyde dehydrogenase [Oenococcus oeni AWRIB418]KDE87123.1 gamma-glutamyl phosphate reductase [Oenococcus oeni]KGH54483.1 gamma-glutamyl phosphate reductase [Oenococcus oeni S22]KGH70342.1 gamma-glutamyl phosphate reductase [Oenococcus oeni S25]